MKVALITVLLMSSVLSASYDYNLQVIELPGEVCSSRHCPASDLGKLSSSSLNYHGVWPNKLDGNHPFYCSQEKYDPSKLTAATLSSLDHIWMGLYASTNVFRSHEYEKHGTCFHIPDESSKFLSLSSSNHQEAFFSTAIEMFQKTGLEAALFSKSTTEDSEWTLDELRGVISQALGVDDFVMQCQWNKKERKASLSTVQVCWSLQLDIIDCPEGFRTTCRDNETLYVTPLKQ